MKIQIITEKEAYDRGLTKHNPIIVGRGGSNVIYSTLVAPKKIKASGTKEDKKEDDNLVTEDRIEHFSVTDIETGDREIIKETKEYKKIREEHERHTDSSGL